MYLPSMPTEMRPVVLGCRIYVPVATHTGFNPRHPKTGGDGQLLEYVGSSIPFPRDEPHAKQLSRLSIAERYVDRDDYLKKYA